MRKSRAWIFGAIMLAMLLALGVSCAKKQVTMETQEMAADESQQAAEDEAARREAEEMRRAREARQRQDMASMSEAARRAAFEDENIHFDFDKYVLTPQAMMILDDKAAY